MGIVIGGLKVEIYQSYIAPDVKGCKDFFLRIWVVAKRVFSYYILRNPDYYNNAFLFEKFKSHSFSQSENELVEGRNIFKLFKHIYSIKRIDLHGIYNILHPKDIELKKNELSDSQIRFIKEFGRPMFRALGSRGLDSIPIFQTQSEDWISILKEIDNASSSEPLMRLDHCGLRALIFQTVRINDNGAEENVLEILAREHFHDGYWESHMKRADQSSELAPGLMNHDANCLYGGLMFERVEQLMKGDALGYLDHDKLQLYHRRFFENPQPKGKACIKLKVFNCKNL